jgi:c-di-GMP-binding flagellar brake protein YcgR
VLVVVALPDEVRFFNRRDGFRVDTTLPVRIQALATGAKGNWIPAGPSLRCFLENLSIGGCSLVTEDPLPTLGRIAIDLPLGSHPLRLHGESVHVDEPKSAGEPWRYGVSFQDVSVPMEDRIHKELLRRQRASLIERSETFDEE